MTNTTARPSVPLSVPKTVSSVAERLGVPLASMVKLDANESPYGPSPSAVAALGRLATEATWLAGVGRYPDPFADDLRAALATYTGIPAEQIVVGNGSDELLNLLLAELIAAGDEVVVAEPTFEAYEHDARQVGAHVIDAGTNADFSVSAERIVQAMGPRTRLVALCSPNNPTGTALPREVALAVLDHAAQLTDSDGHGPLVVIDEAYYDFGALAGDPNAWSAAQLLATGQRVVVLRTFSKIFGLAGLRVGYALCPPDLTTALRARKQPFNANVVGQQAARAALDDLPWLAERARWIVAERSRLAAELAAIAGLRVYPSMANFLMVELPGDSQHRDAILQALLDRGILIRRPGGERVSRCLRVTAGTREQDDQFLAALREVLA